jgi:hypothetical protein
MIGCRLLYGGRVANRTEHQKADLVEEAAGRPPLKPYWIYSPECTKAFLNPCSASTAHTEPWFISSCKQFLKGAFHTKEQDDRLVLQPLDCCPHEVWGFERWTEVRGTQELARAPDDDGKVRRVAKVNQVCMLTSLAVRLASAPLKLYHF